MATNLSKRPAENLTARTDDEEIAIVTAAETRRQSIPLRNILLHFLCIMLFCAFFAQRIEQHSKYFEVTGDAAGYVRLAYNIRTHGTFSRNCLIGENLCPASQQQEIPEPTAYRAPFAAMVYALGLWLDPSTAGMSLAEFMPKSGRLKPEIHRTLRVVNWTVFLITSFCCMAIARIISKSWIVAYLTLFSVAGSDIFATKMKVFLSENIGAMSLSLTLLFLILAFQNNRKWNYTLSGLALGCLALSRSVYAYSWPVFLLLFVLALLWNKTKKKEILIGSALFFITFCITIGSWMLRNYYHFDQFSMERRRGGIALTTRMQFNTMTLEELRASYHIWSRFSASKKILREKFSPEVLVRFDRRNPAGFYRNSHVIASEVLRQHEGDEGEAELKRRAIREILSRPLWHLTVSSSLAVRGVFVENAKTFFENGISISMGIVNVSLFAALGILSVVGLITRDVRILVIAFPILFSIVFYSCFSNFRARYNEPNVPLLWTSLLLVFYWGACLLAKPAQDQR